MSRLRAALGSRADAALETPDGGVAGPELATAAPGPALEGALATGIALSVEDPARLIRLLVALDGRAARLMLLAPDLPAATVSDTTHAAGIDAIVSDRSDLPNAIPAEEALGPAADRAPACDTEWVLTTSGTTGTPKMVRHRLDALARTVRPPAPGPRPAWGLLYEPTRFAGLQVVLQALLGGGRLIAARGTVAERLAFAARAGATHISATPTLWRRVLMSREGLAPTHITLGGEIADDAVLAALAERFPAARLRHIYASTELGVGFSVRDGRAGFPAAWLGQMVEGVGLRLADGLLWLRPPGPPPAYLAHTALTPDADGYLPTGDRIAIEGDRARFLGRESSAVSIGGAKIQPEEVERVLLDHPAIAAATVSSRPSGLTGALLMLTVVPRDADAEPATLRRTIAAFCRERLPREAMPARITVAPEIAMTSAGKIARSAP